MKVSIKSFNVKMDVKTKGIEFQVYDNKDAFLGDCIVSKFGRLRLAGDHSNPIF